MRVLVFNCGSSSLKYKLIEMPSERVLSGGEAQRVGPKTAEPARIIHKVNGKEEIHQADMPSHAVAFERVMELLLRDSPEMPSVMGHRMVHGGAVFSGSALMDDASLAALKEISPLAPLHNPPAVALLEACRKLHPEIPQVAVFDTGFHATIPEYARGYALPRDLSARLGIRKYGFHGTSHHFVAQEAARLLDMPFDKLNAISCHLGSGGASLCAIVGGKSIDNTMGYSPLQGLVMSTRCGDLDPAVAMRLLARTEGDRGKVEALLNKRSGVLGLSGVSADIRDVLSALSRTDNPEPRLDVTAQVYLWRIRKYLGAYLAIAGRVHAVIFTDTIGETSAPVRHAACAGMEWFGLEIDQALNNAVSKRPADVATPRSRTRILVIDTNEELAIARQCVRETGNATAAGAGKAALDTAQTSSAGRAKIVEVNAAAAKGVSQ